jgi:hypothetical protein
VKINKLNGRYDLLYGQHAIQEKRCKTLSKIFDDNKRKYYEKWRKW